LIDVPGQPALEALSAGPEILKMNRVEFEGTFGFHCDGMGEVAAAAQQIMNAHDINSVLITCGEDGILAVTDHHIFSAHAPAQKAVNAAGAGDAVSASITARLALGDPWSTALRWAAATSAAVVLTEGTADCHRSDIERLYPQVEIKTRSVR
jgi:fructose-1-phosphate kinase PfkB-like protein